MAAAYVRMSGKKDGIEYSAFLDWWKMQDDRHTGLRFRSDEESLDFK